MGTGPPTRRRNPAKEVMADTFAAQPTDSHKLFSEMDVVPPLESLADEVSARHGGDDAIGQGSGAEASGGGGQREPGAPASEPQPAGALAPEPRNSHVLFGELELVYLLETLADDVCARHAGDDVILVGIQRRGVDLACRLANCIGSRLGRKPTLGTLDINLYRDDWTSVEGKPHIGESRIPDGIEGSVVILVDDVLFSGRTVRAALEALLDYGRPKIVELLVLVDRGHRELPIQPDYVGRTIKTSPHEHVDVLLRERDGEDVVRLVGR
jgi:pyrimidine operon attenuation protein/uracil phosphoribosyltransferase